MNDQIAALPEFENSRLVGHRSLNRVIQALKSTGDATVLNGQLNPVYGINSMGQRINVSNTGAKAIPLGGCMELTTTFYDFTDLDLMSLHDNPIRGTSTVIAPGSSRVYGIALEPIAIDGSGMVAVHGLCAAQILFHADTDRYAWGAENAGAVAESRPGPGPFRILDKASGGLGTKWAMVFIHQEIEKTFPVQLSVNSGTGTVADPYIYDAKTIHDAALVIATALTPQRRLPFRATAAAQFGIGYYDHEGTFVLSDAYESYTNQPCPSA